VEKIAKTACSLLAIVLLCVPLAVLPASAEETGELELTLQEAAERAYRVSFDLRRAQEERAKARLEKEKATDALRDSYVYLTPEFEEDHRRVVMAELNYHTKIGGEDNAKNNLDVMVVEKYTSVLTAQRELEKARQELALEDWKYSRALVSRNLGITSTAEVDLSKTALDAKRSARAQAEQKLDKAYEEFNILVGFSAERRPRLVSEIAFQPLEIQNIVTEMNRAVDASHDLYALGKFVQIQRLELRSFFLDLDLQEKEVSLAELNEAELRREIQNQVRLFFQDILALEELIDSARIGLDAAEKSLRIARVYYDVGLSVRSDLLQAELDVAVARQRIAELEHSHYDATAVYRNLTGRTIIPEPREL